mgnify:CR=1 FL=1
MAGRRQAFNGSAGTAHTLSLPGRPHLVPEISARQAFYLQCCLVGGMDAPCIYMLHSSDPEPVAIGAFERWAEEAPILPDGTAMPWWVNMRSLFLCLAFVIVGFFLPFMSEWPLFMSIAEWLSFEYHFENLARGVVDTARTDSLKGDARFRPPESRPCRLALLFGVGGGAGGSRVPVDPLETVGREIVAGHGSDGMRAQPGPDGHG